jgi:hypothetical protein
MKWLLLALAACGMARPVVREPGLELETARKFPQALVAYVAACDAGQAHACTRAGVFYRRGRGVAEDNAHALVLFAKGCALHDGESCERALGPSPSPRCKTVEENGKTVMHCVEPRYVETTPEPTHAAACAAGDANGCLALEPPQFDRAVDAGRAACRRHDARGCLALAEALRRQRRKPPLWALPDVEVMALVARAYSILERTCDANVPDACIDARSAMWFIVGYITKECKLSHPPGWATWHEHHDYSGIVVHCEARAEHLGDLERAEVRARRAETLDCAAGDASGCDAIERRDPRHSTAPGTYCTGGPERLCDYWPELVQAQMRSSGDAP